MVRVHVRPVLTEIISVTVMKNEIKIKLDTSTIFHFSELESLIQSSGLEYDLSAIQKAYLLLLRSTSAKLEWMVLPMYLIYLLSQSTW